eukprot:1724632-Rhodomonas_salina.3
MERKDWHAGTTIEVPAGRGHAAFCEKLPSIRKLQGRGSRQRRTGCEGEGQGSKRGGRPGAGVGVGEG